MQFLSPPMMPARLGFGKDWQGALDGAGAQNCPLLESEREPARGGEDEFALAGNEKRKRSQDMSWLGGETKTPLICSCDANTSDNI